MAPIFRYLRTIGFSEAATKLQALKDLSLVLYSSDPTWGTLSPRALAIVTPRGWCYWSQGCCQTSHKAWTASRQRLINCAEVEKPCFIDKKNSGRSENNRGSQNSSWVVDKNTNPHTSVKYSKLWFVLESRKYLSMRIPNDLTQEAALRGRDLDRRRAVIPSSMLFPLHRKFPQYYGYLINAL